MNNGNYKKACINCIYYDYKKPNRYICYSMCNKLNKLIKIHQFSGLFCRFYKNKYKGDNNDKNK